jgi:hypothetical protein
VSASVASGCNYRRRASAAIISLLPVSKPSEPLQVKAHLSARHCSSCCCNKRDACMVPHLASQSQQLIWPRDAHRPCPRRVQVVRRAARLNSVVSVHRGENVDVHLRHVTLRPKRVSTFYLHGKIKVVGVTLCDNSNHSSIQFVTLQIGSMNLVFTTVG